MIAIPFIVICYLCNNKILSPNIFITSPLMQQGHLKLDDGAFWDELDEAEFEECILKENEFLTQNPSLQRKPQNVTVSANENTTGSWVKNDFNSFISEKTNTSSTNKFATNSKLKKETNLWGKDKKPINSNNYASISDSFSQIPKKQNFYKPLEIGSSSSSNDESCSNTSGSKPSVFKVKDDRVNNASEINNLKTQLQEVLQNKAKLEEENLVKQGEVFNLRCELKRKEANYDTERVDHCMAIEAAEKRGKDKALKNLMEIEIKLKSMEKEVDRLQGDLLFKNREVEELVTKCKHLEQRHQPILDSCNGSVSFPSPKKRKIDKISPNKTFNFAGRFDFGNTKKSIKSIQTQTDSETERRKRVFIKIPSKKGITLGSRKTYYLISMSKKKGDSLPSSEEAYKETDADLLGQLIFSDNSPSSSELENKLVTCASSNLEKLLEKFQCENPNSWRNIDRVKAREQISISMLSLIKVLGVVRAESEDVTQNAVRIIALVIKLYLQDMEKNTDAVMESFQSLTTQVKQCSTLSTQLCNIITDSLKGLGRSSTCGIISAFLLALNSLVIFENFKKSICIDSAGKCLLKHICYLLRFFKKVQWHQEMSNYLISFVVLLLRAPSPILANNNCNCSSSLLLTFVNHLHNFSTSSEDTDWHTVFSGVKALHLWKSSDKSWWDKAPHLNAYTALLSTIIRRADYLKSKGILDQHTWELIYEIYEFDDTS